MIGCVAVRPQRLTQQQRHFLSCAPLGMLAVATFALWAATVGLAEAALSISDMNHGATAAALANMLVGSGVTISNVTYTGDPRAAGSFSGGTGIIGFASGIVLGTGKVQTVSGDPACSRGVEGPNTCFESSSGILRNTTDFGRPGDSSLSALSGFSTNDAAILEFDFVPQFSSISFQYVFSSEEYSDFANTEFNDVFAFFVNGVNCAFLPGTSLPVSVNTINNGNDTGGDTTPHHPELFRDNVRPTPTLDTQMDGLTVVLTCTASVIPNQTNHMKLAIADASDGEFDSTVFIQAGSFVSDTTPPDTTITSGPSGTITNTSATFTWTGTDNTTPTANLVYAFRLEPIETAFSAFTSTISKTYSGLANGSYTFRVKARDQTGNEDPTPAFQSFTVSVTPFGYTLASSAGITVTQGGAGSNTVTATLVSGATQPVSFAASGLPTGASAGFSPGACSPTCSTTLTISTSASTPTGTFPIMVTGSPLGRTTSFTLVVSDPTAASASSVTGTEIGRASCRASAVTATLAAGATQTDSLAS